MDCFRNIVGILRKFTWLSQKSNVIDENVSLFYFFLGEKCLLNCSMHLVLTSFQVPSALFAGEEEENHLFRYCVYCSATTRKSQHH